MRTKYVFDGMVSPVAYSVAKWLPLTMNWIFTQIKYIENFHPLILTEQTTNLDLLPPFAIEQISPLTQNWYANLRKLGIRSIPHLYLSSLAQSNVKVIHSHFGDWGWYSLPLVRKSKVKHIVTFYGYDLGLLPASKPKWKKRYEELFQEADQFLCEGPFMARSLAGLGCPTEKIQVQKLGVDLEEIPFVERESAAKGKIKILIAGRFVEKKGIPYALEAIGKLRSKMPGVKVTVYGDSTGIPRDEIEKRRIFDVIKKYQLDPNVQMMGFQPMKALTKSMYDHDIFLSPSVSASDGDTEGGAPVTIIQALASGMPVISTTHCDIPGVVENGISGFLSRERDVDSLVNSLEVLVNDPQKRKQMAKAGRKHVELEFNARIQGQHLKKIYDSFC